MVMAILVSGLIVVVLSFFFQAEDGIRDYKVTGVQTCALPISRTRIPGASRAALPASMTSTPHPQPLLALEHAQKSFGAVHALEDGDIELHAGEIGRASCRERV